MERVFMWIVGHVDKVRSVLSAPERRRPLGIANGTQSKHAQIPHGITDH